jgi:asparagine synthase (glutamine-hydrolysing)
MCGIVGGVGTLARKPGTFAAALDRLRHRGPDDRGLWHEAGVVLGHTRLAILDLSPAGHQPMQSAHGSHVIVFNGEIYNHQDLRGRLKGEAWQGHSDTESLLACIASWGVERTLQACDGMFAFAVWDRRSRTLTLARDRLGEKPLYYGFIGDSFVFASELKALSCLPGFNRDIDRDAMAIQLRHGAVPAPYCIYKGLAKLTPGCWLALSEEDLTLRRMPDQRCYWSAARVAVEGLATPMRFASDDEAADALECELQRAVSGQMLADVPVGAFLSGGIDSSTLVALMQARGGPQVHTFSIGFREPRYDEAVYARAVARHLGTQHTELYVTSTEARAVIPELPELYDEPFSDSSQIPTVLLARLARTRVTVALSGDGGDELFAGYTRYAQTERLWHRVERVPKLLRHLAARVIPWLPPQVWDALFTGVSPLLPSRYRWPMSGDRLHKGAALLRAADGVALYRDLISNIDPAGLVLGAGEAATALTRPLPVLPTLTDRMLLLDILQYLPDILLVKLDRAAMATSLETRVPMLDHRVVEFAWRLPLHYKNRDGQGKWLLRRVLHRHVPPALVDRPKMGFGVPIDSWLRGPLRDWAEALLDEARLRREGYFDPVPIRQKWREHLSGHRAWHYHLWDILMFQAWLEAQGG